MKKEIFVIKVTENSYLIIQKKGEKFLQACYVDATGELSEHIFAQTPRKERLRMQKELNSFIEKKLEELKELGEEFQKKVTDLFSRPLFPKQSGCGDNPYMYSLML